MWSSEYCSKKPEQRDGSNVFMALQCSVPTFPTSPPLADDSMEMYFSHKSEGREGVRAEMVTYLLEEPIECWLTDVCVAIVSYGLLIHVPQHLQATFDPCGHTMPLQFQALLVQRVWHRGCGH